MVSSLNKSLIGQRMKRVFPNTRGDSPTDSTFIDIPQSIRSTTASHPTIHLGNDFSRANKFPSPVRSSSLLCNPIVEIFPSGAKRHGVPV